MTSASSLFRSLVIYGLCLPLAVFLGYLLANPFDLQTLTALGLVLLLLLIPLLLRWHHTWLIAVWNSTMVLYFLPGKPATWSVLAWVGLSIALLQYILDRRQKFLSVPSMTRPLIFLVLVVLITARATGGMGMQIFGGDTIGGKRYLMILSGIAGYFALTSQRIPQQRALFFVVLFFIGAVTIGMGEVGDVLGPVAKPLVAFFPQATAGGASTTSIVAGATAVRRMVFLAPAGAGLIYILLARHGIRGIFTWSHPVRLVAFVGCILLTMVGGYRSAMILFLLTFALVFYLEGLMRSPLLPTFMLAGVLAVTVATPFTSYLPQSLQRSLAFLPLPVSEEVRLSAQGSTEWRVGMWHNVLPQIPEYFWLGKGYTFSGNELFGKVYLSGAGGTGGFEMASEYHNGPLSIILPFGIWGVIAYIWFLVVALRILHRNYLYGDPNLRRFNTILLAYFVAKTVLFLVVAGGFYNDFFLMLGVVGFSISLNGGVAQPAPAPVLRIAPRRVAPPRAAYKPAGA